MGNGLVALFAPLIMAGFFLYALLIFVDMVMLFRGSATPNDG